MNDRPINASEWFQIAPMLADKSPDPSAPPKPTNDADGPPSTQSADASTSDNIPCEYPLGLPATFTALPGSYSTETDYDAAQILRHFWCLPYDRSRFRFRGGASDKPALHTRGHRQRNRGLAQAALRGRPESGAANHRYQQRLCLAGHSDGSHQDY